MDIEDVKEELAWWKNPAKVKATFLTWAEMIDAWRIIPRAILVAYSWMLLKVITWYMELEPYFPEEVKALVANQTVITPEIKALMVEAPTTQHAALVTAVIGISAAIFGLYSNSGRKWNSSTEKLGD